MTAPSHDPTLDPARRSWVESANDPDGDFPIQNLPLGVFRAEGNSQRIGVAIGDSVLDLTGCATERLLEGVDERAARALGAPTLNDLMALGAASRRAVRRAASALLARGTTRLAENVRDRLLRPRAQVQMLLPAHIGDYTDFYASIDHATNVGGMFRPDNPLLPNYRHLPIGYHGRASSIVVSGTPVRRPRGQTRADDAEAPVFGPTRLLDYELEMGLFVGPGNDLGQAIPLARAHDHVFGMVLVNDWSARDVQKWEYQPLGPFNAKNFATTISPWVVTLEALEPFRVTGPPRGPQDPPLLEYLRPQGDAARWGLDIQVEAWLSSRAMRDAGQSPLRLSRADFARMYWTVTQMVAHHTSGGCNLRPGDLLASGTVSGPEPSARGCMLELTWRGQNPIALPDGTQRRFLQDGDEVTLRASCRRDGAAPIGFGECRGVILPA
jgi:fumarylacetoacetase